MCYKAKGNLGDTMKSITIVCVRVFAAYLVLTFMGMLASMLSPLLMIRSFNEIPWLVLVAPLAMIVIGVLMLLVSKSLATLVLAGVPEPAFALPDSQHILQIGTALIGIFLLATALPSLLAAVLQYLRVGGLGSLGSRTEIAILIDQQGAIASIVRSTGSLIVGALLLVMSRQIAKLWRPPSADAAGA